MNTKFKPGDIVQAKVHSYDPVSDYVDLKPQVYPYDSRGCLHAAYFTRIGHVKETPEMKAEQDLIAASISYRLSNSSKPVAHWGNSKIRAVLEAAAADRLIAYKKKANQVLQESEDPPKVGDMLQVEVVGIDRKGSALTLKHQSGISKYAIYFSRSEEYYDGSESKSAPVVNTPLQEAERELISATLAYSSYRHKPDPVPEYSYPLMCKVFDAADRVIALQAPPMTDLETAVALIEEFKNAPYLGTGSLQRIIDLRDKADQVLNKIKGSK